MAMAQVQPRLLSIGDYLELEACSPQRQEYLAGYCYAMTGGSQAHNLVTVNLTFRLRQHLGVGACRVFSSDMKVFIESLQTFYYPDLAVSCAPETRSPYFIESPCLVAEVLSPGTERQDRNEKRDHYRQLGSLREFVLVDPRCRWVQVDRRSQTGRWETELLSGSQTLRLTSVDLALPLDWIYEGLESPEDS
jgi:Uma2 family endonuclease